MLEVVIVGGSCSGKVDDQATDSFRSLLAAAGSCFLDPTGAMPKSPIALTVSLVFLGCQDVVLST